MNILFGIGLVALLYILLGIVVLGIAWLIRIRPWATYIFKGPLTLPHSITIVVLWPLFVAEVFNVRIGDWLIDVLDDSGFALQPSLINFVRTLVSRLGGK